MRSTALFSLIVLLLAACSDHKQRLLLLEELERQNRADSVMRNDSLARDLCEWFDDHGTANERLRAHYILGRTYADLGEAPAAIAAYMDAADCADTTATACDYHTLSRVYGQMGAVYYRQNLMELYLSSLDKSTFFALLDNDTLQTLNNEAHKILAYDRLRQNDSVIVAFERFFQQFNRIYGMKRTAQYCILPVKALIEKGDYQHAGRYLQIMEEESGYFNSSGEIERGRESYYYYKGRYHLAMQQYAAAEACFRKELCCGCDAINQSMALRGLSLLYSQMGVPDSAAKYALLSYEMNDTAYSGMATGEVAQMTAVYNYNRHLTMAEKEHREAEKRKWEIMYLYIALVALCLLILLAFFHWKRRKTAVDRLYWEKVAELSHMRVENEKIQGDYDELQTQLKNMQDDLECKRKEVENLRSYSNGLNMLTNGDVPSPVTEIISTHEVQLRQIIETKEEELRQKEAELATLRENEVLLEAEMHEKDLAMEELKEELCTHRQHSTIVDNESEEKLQESDTYKWLHKPCDSGILSERDWKRIDGTIETYLPRFHSFLKSEKHKLNQREYRLCLLFRLHVRMKEASVFMGVAQSQVTRSSKDVLRKLFAASGASKDLVKRLESI